jgi:diamine N-acetyltransferase
LPRCREPRQTRAGVPPSFIRLARARRGERRKAANHRHRRRPAIRLSKLTAASPGGATSRRRGIAEQDIKEAVITESGDPIEPILWLRGERAALGPYVRELVPEYWRWESEPTTLIGSGLQSAETIYSRAETFDNQTRWGHPYFTIYDNTDGHPVPVGLSALMVDSRTHTGELFITVGSEGRGKGLAGEATRLTVDYGFHVANLRNIYLAVLAPNKAGIRAFTNAGFKEMGRRRGSGYWRGEVVDHVFMDIVPDDFPGPSVIKDQQREDDE